MNSPRVAFVSTGEREQGIACPDVAAVLRLGEPIAVCQACGAVHHQDCWEANPTCGSYACAPARRALQPGQQGVLKITSEDLNGATPLPARQTVSFSSAGGRPAALPRTSRLAWAAFITALAGVPFFGVLTGLVAITLGSFALGQLRRTGQRGIGLALIGVLLGLGDVVAWLVFLTVMLSQPSPLVRFDSLRLDAAALENLDPILSRAMRANVLIEARHGWGSRAIGSGVILRIERGEALVVTNRHVVDPSFSGSPKDGDGHPKLPDVPVLLIGQAVCPGAVVWLAPHGIDLALIQVPCVTDQARPARWRRDHRLRVGQTVFAVGNPHGLSWTHTQGVLSQLRRQDHEGFELRVIQTQAALNPGNSGGGLFDQEGFLIGINTWVKDKRVSEGLNFAIAFETLPQLAPPQLALPESADAPEKP